MFFVWDTKYQKAFDDIKQYLINPPMLVDSVSGKSFLLYMRAVDHALGALLAQTNGKGHNQVIYYLSQTMIVAKHRYNSIEKECLALTSAVQKMRDYLVEQATHLISEVNPLKILIT